MDTKLKTVIKRLTQVDFRNNDAFWQIVSPVLFTRLRRALLFDFKSNKGFVLVPNDNDACATYKLVSELTSVMTSLEKEGLIFVSDSHYHSDFSLVYGKGIVLDSNPFPSRFESREYDVIIDQESSSSYSLKDGDSILLSYELPEQIFNPLSRYLFSIIYPTNELDCYVSHGFVKEDDYRTGKALKVSRIAILVAILIGILTPLISVLIANRFGITTLNERQLSLIINSIQR